RRPPRATLCPYTTLFRSLRDGVARPLSVLGQEGALRFPARMAYIQRVVRQDPDLATHIPTLARMPGCVGIRVVLTSRKERQAFADRKSTRLNSSHVKISY